MDFFNTTIQNLGTILFGDDSEADELQKLVNALSDKDCEKFEKAVDDAMILSKD